MKVKLSTTELDVLKTLNNSEGATQREIAEANGASLGSINGAIVKLKELGYVGADNCITIRRRCSRFMERFLLSAL